jgi:G:T-mismatch repair DNA endonuclease (very short patch repair protein)
MLKLTNEFVIQRLQLLYGDTYDLSKVNYTGQNNKLTLICPLHGEWAKMAQKLFGYGVSRLMGCPKCNLANMSKHRTYNRLKTTEEFIQQAKEVHGDIYNYSLVNYKNGDTKIDIICPSHGTFTQLPWGHLKYGCRSCNVHTSKIEKEWLKSLGITTLIQQYKIPNLNFTVDGYDPVKNTVYEFYGDYWHGNPKKFFADKINTRTPKQKTFGQLYEDTIKRETMLRDAGYNIVSVWESDIR